MNNIDSFQKLTLRYNKSVRSIFMNDFIKMILKTPLSCIFILKKVYIYDSRLVHWKNCFTLGRQIYTMGVI